MEHYENFKTNATHIKHLFTSPAKALKSFTWNFVERNWSQLRILVFLFSVLLNIIVCVTYKKTFDTENGIIPIPGVDTQDSTDAILSGDFTHAGAEMAIFILGLIQLFMAAGLFGLYVYFYAKLKVKKQFSFEKDTKWEKKDFDIEFVFKYLSYTLKDTQMWTFLLFFGISFLGFSVSPLIYCLLLFEVVARAPTLRSVLQAIQNNVKSLALTGVLMTFSVFFFSVLYFSWSASDFTLGDGTRLCDTQYQCFVAIFNYGLRGGGFWEDIMDPVVSPLRFVLDMAFFFAVIIVLINIVFGIILDAFADIRQNAENTEKLIKDKCFICDIDRARFDMKANEGITFHDHIKHEHYMWDYVFFLIYLFEKEVTEYTGVEQYIFNMAEGDDISFFPILRSLTLEESDAKNKVRHINDQDDLDEQEGELGEWEDPRTNKSSNTAPALERKNSFSGANSFNLSSSSLKREDSLNKWS